MATLCCVCVVVVVTRGECIIVTTRGVRCILMEVVSGCATFFEHSPPRLASRHPIWSAMTSVDTITQWREDWSSASVVSHTIVTDPTIRQPGFDLPRHTWFLLNRFRTDQGPCCANLHKWGLARSPSCNCGQ